MKIKVLSIGKTDNKNIQVLLEDYKKRLSHYGPFEWIELPDVKNVKNLSEAQQKQAEAQLVLKQLTPADQLILLDEKGKRLSSEDFAQYLQKKMNSGLKQLVLLIGGPYGFSPELYQRANGKLSLSDMTFSHQMVRLFLIEQLYRAHSILRNEPYHHR